MDLSGLTALFVGAHVLLAQRTDTPELELNPDEASAFLASAQNVMRHYSVATTQKMIDWTTFIGTGVTIYGTRAIAIAARREEEKKSRKGRTVVPFPAMGTPPIVVDETPPIDAA